MQVAASRHDTTTRSVHRQHVVITDSAGHATGCHSVPIRSIQPAEVEWAVKALTNLIQVPSLLWYHYATCCCLRLNRFCFYSLAQLMFCSLPAALATILPKLRPPPLVHLTLLRRCCSLGSRRLFSGHAAALLLSSKALPTFVRTLLDPLFILGTFSQLTLRFMIRLYVW